MNVRLNGEKREIEPCTLAELLEQLGLHERRVATLINDEIVKQDARSLTQIKENDTIDVIAMVGGG